MNSTKGIGEALRKVAEESGAHIKLKPSEKVDEWDLERRKVEAFNAVEGNLHINDGIDCRKCRNKGFIEVLVGDPGKDDIPNVNTIPCECLAKREATANAKAAGLGEMFGKKWKDYEAKEDWQISAKQTAYDYAENPVGWMACLGQVGSGKTLLASCVANHLLRKGRRVKVVSWPELARKCEAEWFQPDSPTMREAQEIEVLYIDDMFKDGCKGRSEDSAFQLLDYRSRNKMPTIITSELLPGDFLNLNEGLWSRIRMNCRDHVIAIGKDRRKDQRTNDYPG